MVTVVREINEALQLQYETAAYFAELAKTVGANPDEVLRSLREGHYPDSDPLRGELSQREKDEIENDPQAGAKARFFMGHFAHMVATAPTFWVSPAMCQLIEAAAEDLDQDILFDLDWKHTVFSDSGFVVFATPFSQAYMGLDYLALDKSRQEIYAPLKTLAWENTEVGECVALANPASSWIAHPTSEQDHEYGPGLGFLQRRPDYPRWMPFVAGFLLLAQQRISTTKTRSGPRQIRRKMGRELGHAGEVTVVTLRKTQNRRDSKTNDPVDWKVRWKVSGHWRKQWYSSTKVHRLIWISPYVKGPPDKPLVINHRTFRLIR